MSKAKTKTRIRSRAKSASGKTKYRLTVAADKLAVLLRLPKTTIKLIDGMAKDQGNGAKRTSVIYDIIARHPLLSESMQPLLTDNR